MDLCSSVRRYRWLSLWFLIAAFCWLWFTVATPTASYSQEPEVPQQQNDGEGGAKKADTKKQAEAASPSAADSIMGYARQIIFILGSNGWFFGGLFFVVSIILGILIIVSFFDLRMGAAIPVGFVEEFTDTVNKRQFKQAFDLCRADNSFLARVLTSGMGRLQYGVEDARHAAFNTVEAIRKGKEQILNYLANVATIAPLLGLFGTVDGMIGAFQIIATAGGEPEPQKIAGEISKALGTTWVGIFLAVPAIIFNVFFRNRLTRITMDTANLADDLLTQMYHNSKKGAAAAAAAPAAAAAQGRPASPNTPATPTARPAE